jgi:hypothetical protein
MGYSPIGLVCDSGSADLSDASLNFPDSYNIKGSVAKKMLIPDTGFFEIKLLFAGRWYEQ